MDTTTIWIFAAQTIISILVAVGAAWAFAARMDQRVKHLEDGNIRDRLTSMEERINSIKESLSTLNGNIALLLSRNGRLVKSNSPVSLTEKGESIADQIAAQARVNANWETIRRELNTNLAASNPYDIQQYCLEKIAATPERFFSVPDLDAMKTIAYKNGDAFFEYCQVLGVIVRDRYLKEKGINTGEVDKFDPEKQHHETSP